MTALTARIPAPIRERAHDHRRAQGLAAAAQQVNITEFPGIHRHLGRQPQPQAHALLGTDAPTFERPARLELQEGPARPQGSKR